jgi:hypothetical protein
MYQYPLAKHIWKRFNRETESKNEKLCDIFCIYYGKINIKYERDYNLG